MQMKGHFNLVILSFLIGAAVGGVTISLYEGKEEQASDSRITLANLVSSRLVYETPKQYIDGFMMHGPKVFIVNKGTINLEGIANALYMKSFTNRGIFENQIVDIVLRKFRETERFDRFTESYHSAYSVYYCGLEDIYYDIILEYDIELVFITSGYFNRKYVRGLGYSIEECVDM